MMLMMVNFSDYVYMTLTVRCLEPMMRVDNDGLVSVSHLLE